VSRNPAAALSGTGIERKTTVSSSSANPTTSTRNTGSAAVSLSEVSMLIAVWPVTIASMPDWLRILAPSSRIEATRSFVACDEGLPLGVTMMIATCPLLLKTGSETAATPSNLRSSSLAATAIALGSFVFPKSITVVRGPANPGPNALVSRS
jgi:hypothetical protein